MKDRRDKSSGGCCNDLCEKREQAEWKESESGVCVGEGVRVGVKGEILKTCYVKRFLIFFLLILIEFG